MNETIVENLYRTTVTICNTPAGVVVTCRYQNLKNSESELYAPWRAIRLRYFLKIKNLGNGSLDINKWKKDF